MDVDAVLVEKLADGIIEMVEEVTPWEVALIAIDTGKAIGLRTHCDAKVMKKLLKGMAKDERIRKIMQEILED